MAGVPSFRTALPYGLIFLLAAALAWLSFATSFNEIPYPSRYLFSDDLIYLTYAKNFTESWSVYSYDRLAAPFRFDAVDFPFFTFTNFAVIAAIDAFVDNIQHSAFFFLVAHIGASAALTMGACRMLGLGIVPSALAGLAYGLTPYTLTRNVSHMDFAVGVTFPLLLMLLIAAAKADAGQPGRHRLLVPLGFLFGAFTVVQQFYYSFYVVIFIAVLWLFWFLPRRSWWSLGVTAAIGAGIVVSVLIFILSFQWSEYAEIGRNLTYTRRSVSSTTNFSLILSYLVLPQEFHRISEFVDTKMNLNTAMGMDGRPRFDIWTHSVGLFATVGLGYLVMRLFSPWRAARPFPMSSDGDAALRTAMVGMLGTMVLAAVLYGVPGGGAAMLAQYISPQFHAVQRIALAIACFGTVAAAILMQSLSERYEARRTAGIPLRRTMSSAQVGLIAFLVGAGVIYGDQTVDYRGDNSYSPENRTAPARIKSDKKFFSIIESKLRPNSGVYIFPLGHWGGVYDQSMLRPYINTNNINFSSLSIFPRQSYNWGSELSKLDFDSIVKRLEGKGFSAVIVMPKIFDFARENPYTSYSMDSVEIGRRFEAISPEPPIVSDDGEFRFYLLPGHESATLRRNCEPYALGTPLGFTADDLNFRYFDLGWAQPAANGTWMARINGFPAYMNLCINDLPARDLKLTIKLDPAVNANTPKLDMVVTVNGEEVATVSFDLDRNPGSQEITAVIPAEIAASRTPLSIGFQYSRAGIDVRSEGYLGGLIEGLRIY